MERDIKTAVITGATGAIGVALCHCLISDGIKAYAVVRPDSDRVKVLENQKELNIIRLDLSELNSLPEKIEKCDAFFHLGWANTIGTGRNDMDSQIANISNTVHAVRAAKALDCKVFVGAGSQAEYGRAEGSLKADTPAFPENGYGMAKLCAGQMSRIECEKLDIDWVWPRILSVYGPGDGKNTMISTVIEKLLKGEKPSLTAGEQQWDYLYSEDAARALLLMAKYGINGKVYPTGSGKTRQLRKYVEVMRDTINSELELGFGEIPYSDKQVMLLRADITELTRDTGFEPEVEFEEGIRYTIESMVSSKVLTN